MKCPECGAWTDLISQWRRKAGTMRKYTCGNEHTFTVFERDKLPPRQKPPQANFNTPQAKNGLQKHTNPRA